MKISASFCLLTISILFLLSFPVFAQQTEREFFALELPELSTGRINAPKTYVARTDVNLVKFWILNPAAGTIDWGKIKTRINGKSANVGCSQKSNGLGKFMDCDLNRIAGFRLKKSDNLFEIEATSREGKYFFVSFVVITDAKAAVKRNNSKSEAAIQQNSGKSSDVKIPSAVLGFSGRKFAVVIGVSEYKYKDMGLDNLNYADDDAAAFNSWLTKTGGFSKENILYMTNKDATLSAVRDSLIRFLSLATENDLVLFFLAGHGTPDPFNPSELYYLVYDSKVADLKNTGFSMKVLKSIIDKKLKSKRAVFLLDTCHSAGISSGKKIVVPQRRGKSGKGERGIFDDDYDERDLERVEIKNDVSNTAARLFLSAGRAVLTSSDIAETSRESERWGGGHGVFTWALLEGLRGNADSNSNKIITTDELFEFVRQKVRAETKAKQNPRLFSNLGTGLEIAVLK